MDCQQRCRSDTVVTSDRIAAEDMQTFVAAEHAAETVADAEDQSAVLVTERNVAFFAMSARRDSVQAALVLRQ